MNKISSYIFSYYNDAYSPSKFLKEILKSDSKKRIGILLILQVI